MKPRLFFLLILILPVFSISQTVKTPADYIDPFIGSINNGSCMPGPCLPHASIYPSPNTLNGHNGGYAVDEKITGFAQLHAQGTGGLKPYGNFLISPQIGLKIKESEHQSKKSEEVANAFYYKVRLRDYNIFCELAPSKNSAIYRFTFPESDDATLLFDVARKNGGDLGLEKGTVEVSDDGKIISGGGVYGNNWPDGVHKWDMYFYAEVSEPAKETGVFEGDKISKKEQGAAEKNGLGAYLKFDTKNKQEVYVKIAVSFVSVEHAKELLNNEIPAWDFELVKEQARQEWNKYMSKIQIEATDEEKTIFYTHLFHSFVQPRDRTGNNLWHTDEDFWDDHYTIWDSWKTLFPLMSIIDQDMVASNVRSLISRHKHNGYVAAAFINGKESWVGQGGNTADNLIGDAFVRDIPGIDWEEAYKVLKYSADSVRTKAYRENGYMYHNEPTNYSWRMKAGSGTIAFSVNDHCAAMLAKALDKKDDYKKYSERSENWKNTWNAEAESDGFKGFIMARNQDGSFDEIDPKTGSNKHFYEGTCWIYSYEIPHDVAEMVRMMGGKKTFINRLKYAMDNDLIEFGNEPSFMTPWLFANENVERPDLTSFYIREQLLPNFTRFDLPGDDDQGAMASLFVFAKLGLFPFATTDKYYLHGGSYKDVKVSLPDGKIFEIQAKNASSENIYMKSVTLNGEKLNRSWISHQEIMQGGKLVFEMTSEAVNYLD